ncbi:MAG: transcriptional repressor LexA [Firmicutes bacterium]|nr:transcriptional repressor LexA [Bacillota bacterium]MBV1727614.1 transcriptional repressor LexA [Desulforudis sp.]MBU4534208.1 transcriptional repressor LexA [Bacillota bacterium]MBU4554461.1 transcriptional repressor LexA [Bacillota bacterium]MBV1735857.1 transcriptional repressor LexA [Desulforudis sp.]
MMVGGIIREARREQGWNQRRLAEAAGLSPQYLSDIEKGRAKPSLKSLEKIANALSVSVTRLLVDRNETGSIVEVPLLGRVPAGGPVLAEENILEHIPFAARFVREPAFCLEVKGDSMIDLGIEEGDIVLVRAQPVAENGQTVIARVDGEVTCKRFYAWDGKIRLEPANRAYRPIVGNEVEILGVVSYLVKKI